VAQVLREWLELALGLALTGMLNDGEITRDRAFELAHMLLHDNAAKLYHLDKLYDLK
jgi:hypothetical protein